MPEQNYTLKVTRSEINELALAISERRERLEKEWFEQQPVKSDDPHVKELAKHLDDLARLQSRIG